MTNKTIINLKLYSENKGFYHLNNTFFIPFLELNPLLNVATYPAKDRTSKCLPLPPTR